MEAAYWFFPMIAVSLIIVLLIKWCMRASSADTNGNMKNNRNTRYSHQYYETTDLNRTDWDEPYTYDVDYGCNSGDAGDSFVVHNIGGENWGDTGQSDNCHTRSRDTDGCCDNDNSGGGCDSGGGDTGGGHSGGVDTGGCDSGGGDSGGCDSGGGDSGGCDSGGGGCDD